MIESPSVRPLVEMEFAERGPFSVCSCDRKSQIEYLIRWVQTQYSSSRYAWRGGRASQKQRHADTVCHKCAQKFAVENDLRLLPAPHPDPAPGQIWRHATTGARVSIVQIRLNLAALRPEVAFEPGVTSGNVHLDALLIRLFLTEFYPE